MTDPLTDRADKQRIAEELVSEVENARRLAQRLGLSPYHVNYWIVDYEEMNALVAYNGFQDRYPHWRWGMTYEQQAKQRRFLGGKAYELVNNDDPAHAFLQESNELSDQKAVITHVEAHADFFANNQWYGLFAEDPDAARMLATHAETIESYMNDPEIDREAVEEWIDNILCLTDCIDQHRPFTTADDWMGEDGPEIDIDEKLAELNLSEEVIGQVFDEEWLERQNEEDLTSFPAEPERDVIAFLRAHGMQYEGNAEKAMEFEDWQRDILELLRRETYYFAPQKMTKIMNEGWAAYWESVMMGEEGFADGNEFLSYADHQSKVLGSPGFNPYKLGKELWEYIENLTNRRHVVEQLLRVEDVTWRNIHDTVDLDAVLAQLEPDAIVNRVESETLDSLDSEDPRIDSEGLAAARAGEIDVDQYPWKLLTEAGLAERHYSLTKLQNRGFLEQITQSDVERIARYMFDDARYATVEEAVADVEYSIGWDRMFEIRESHNDVTFLDAYLTQEFVDEHNYFSYEYIESAEEFQVTSTDVEDVKKKLMLQFSNFGKPTIVVEDGNYNNRNELLLSHLYNGVMIDVEQAKQVLERTFELWGHPVNLKTIVKELDENDIEVARRRDKEPTPEERGKLLRYDGEEVSAHDLPWEDVEHLAATDVDYDTKPEEWLA